MKINQDRKQSFLYYVLDDIKINGWREDFFDSYTREGVFTENEIRVFFPKGRIDFLRYWFDLSDALMSDDLDEIEVLELKVRDRIKTIIKIRLERWKDFKVSIKKTLPVLLMPSYTTHFTFSLMQTSNLIWKIAGDRSVDFNFYTKRGLLLGVYSTTLIYWLDDNSKNDQNTWEFLDRRIEEVLQVPKVKQNIRFSINQLKNNISKTINIF